LIQFLNIVLNAQILAVVTGLSPVVNKSNERYMQSQDQSRL